MKTVREQLFGWDYYHCGGSCACVEPTGDIRFHGRTLTVQQAEEEAAVLQAAARRARSLPRPVPLQDPEPF